MSGEPGGDNPNTDDPESARGWASCNASETRAHPARPPCCNWSGQSGVDQALPVLRQRGQPAQQCRLLPAVVPLHQELVQATGPAAGLAQRGLTLGREVQQTRATGGGPALPDAP